jgi:putative spermidine/putrescine transport system permease protein
MLTGPPQTLTSRMAHGARWALSVLTLLFLIAPLIAIVPLSFNSGAFLTYPLEGFSLRWYRALFASSEWLLAFRNSMIIGATATFLATTLGTLAALGLAHERFPFRGAVMAFIVSPMVVPIVIVAVGLYYFFAALGLTETYTGLILAHTMLAAPLVVITVSAALSSFDWNLTRAAFSLGAGPVRVFFKVILPLALPGVCSGALLAFATSLDEVVTVIFLAGPDQFTLPRQMLVGIRDYINPTITAVATVMMIISVLLLTTIEIVRRRAKRMSVSPLTSRPLPEDARA